MTEASPLPALDAVQPLIEQSKLTWQQVSISADGAHYAYDEDSGFNRRIVIDGKPGPEFDRVRDCRLGRDGKYATYWADKDDKEYFVWVTPGGEKMIPSEDIANGPERVRLSPAMDCLMFVFVDRAQPGGRNGNPRDRLFIRRMTPKGNLPDIEVVPVHGMPPVEATADLAHVATFTATFATKNTPLRYHVTLDGKTVGTIADGNSGIHRLMISPDGRRVCWQETGQNSGLFCDGRRLDGPVVWAAFSPDSAHLAWVRESPDRRSRELVADGQSLGRFDYVQDTFISRDGMAIGFVAVKNNKAALMIKPMPGAKVDPASEKLWAELARDIRNLDDWADFTAAFGPTHREFAYHTPAKGLIKFLNGVQATQPEAQGRRRGYTTMKGMQYLPAGKHVLTLLNGLAVDGHHVEYSPIPTAALHAALSTQNAEAAMNAVLLPRGPDEFFFVGTSHRGGDGRPMGVKLTIAPDDGSEVTAGNPAAPKRTSTPRGTGRTANTGRGGRSAPQQEPGQPQSVVAGTTRTPQGQAQGETQTPGTATPAPADTSPRPMADPKVAAGGAAAVPAGSQPPPTVPYERWAKFKPGASATYEETVESLQFDPAKLAAAPETKKRKVRLVLKSVTADAAEVEEYHDDATTPATTPAATQRLEKNAKPAPGQEQLGGWKAGNVEAMNRQWACHSSNSMTKTADGGITATTTWYHADVPGGVVKSTGGGATGTGYSKFERVLTAFETGN